MSACPDWCQDGDCKGEHSAYVAEPVPMTAGLPHAAQIGGFYFPGAQVSIQHDVVDNLQPCVSLFITSEGHEAQGDLHPHEARALIETLQLALDVLEGRASLKEPEWPRLARVEDYRGAAS